MPPTILLVDDDALLRRALAYSLERAGFAVRTAGDAAAGLALARAAAPDLVLLDVGLPGMSGLDALPLFRALQLPVIMLTARRSREDEALARQLGAGDYLTKPCDFDRLLARSRALLDAPAPCPLSPAP